MIQTEKSGTLACNNDQTLFVFKQTSFGAYEDGIGTLRASGGDIGGGSENLVVIHGSSAACVQETGRE